jgi:hypothetical protein
MSRYGQVVKALLAALMVSQLDSQLVFYFKECSLSYFDIKKCVIRRSEIKRRTDLPDGRAVNIVPPPLNF